MLEIFLVVLIREADVQALLPMRDAMRLVEDAFRMQATGRAINSPRQRVRYPNGLLHVLPGVVPGVGAAGIKSYVSTRLGVTFTLVLFDSDSGELLALIEADWLGRLRTGAASGVATKFMAMMDARVAGVIGAGGQAETQLRALAEARPFELIKVFSRSVERREALAARLDQDLEPEVVAVSSAEEAVRGSQVVTTITTAAEPVFKGEWLEENAHVNAAGSNQAGRREIDEIAVARASSIVVDSREQAQQEAGDLILADQRGSFEWDDVVELSQVVSGETSVDAGQGITLYESQGIAIEDIIVARWVFDRAVSGGFGEAIRFGERPV